MADQTERFREAARKIAVEVVDFAQGCTIENCYSLRHHERSHEHAEWEIAQALAAAYAAGQAEARTWRPIETAPRDGTVIIGIRLRPKSGRHEVWALRWMPAEYYAEQSGEDPDEFDPGWETLTGDTDAEPTHWCPFQSPPAAEPAREDGA